MTMGWSKFVNKGAPILLAVVATVSTVCLLKDDLSAPLPHETLRGDAGRYSAYVPPDSQRRLDTVSQRRLDTDSQRRLDTDSQPSLDIDSQRRLAAYIPSSLDAEGQRRLANSLNLGGGLCQWQPPTYEVPGGIDFHKTVIAGFPSGDKRMVFVQMEALTGWPAKDEWDFAFLGMSNHPFIKANYPHHEGIWGWQGVADQVALIVPNIRRSMVEYHDIVWDLGYATTWEQATSLSDNLFASRPHLDDYYDWRDERVLDEAHWYGWFIDYWMEGGLRRDIFTHKLTTQEHWDDLLIKPFYTRAELEYSLYVSNETEVTPTYDGHCTSGEITNGCEPVAVLSADWLRNHAKGPAETTAIANVLQNDVRTGQYLIEQEAWDCIWDELIITRKGPVQVWDRPGVNAEGYNFSPEMLEEMISELDRLIDKYGNSPWDAKATAVRLVEILVEHRGLIQTELNEVNAGVRKLTDKDFLGPKERAKRALRQRAQQRAHNRESDGEPEKLDPVRRTNEHAKYFVALEQKRLEDMRSAVAGDEGRRLEKKISHEEYVKHYLEVTKARAELYNMELGPEMLSKL